jgi:biotin synthase
VSEKIIFFIDKLQQNRHLEAAEYEQLIDGFCPETAQYAAQKAVIERKKIYGNEIYVRGLIEISNICKNNCLYCGIRRDNPHCSRYRLTEEEILDCCREGERLGIRTFVLQGGEDPYFTDAVLVGLLHRIKEAYPHCAITLSLGERQRESYEALFRAGAERYLLRHETANEDHYRSLHPPEMSFAHRMQCLEELKEIGYQTGCGFMVGSPGQTKEMLAEELQFVEAFRPQMCGIGPFIPHKETIFRDKMPGSVELTCYLLSLIRLIHPGILLPATTALGTLDPQGREKGIQAGANVVMPNLSPVSVRKKYELYDNKICTGEESAQCIGCLNRRMESIGYEIVSARGDSRIDNKGEKQCTIQNH